MYVTRIDRALTENAGMYNAYSGTYFKLTKDIDLGNNEWLPIGRLGMRFNGTFDGGGHVVRNIKVTKNYYGIGLFGATGIKASISDIGVENAKFVYSSAQGNNAKDYSATITATIGDKSRSFEVTVLPYTSAKEVIEVSKDRLKFSNFTTDKIDNIKNTLSLPATDEYGTLIRWESSDTAILKIVQDGDAFKGIITRPSFSDGSCSVFLTATLLYGDAYEKKQFYLTVSEIDVNYVYSSTLSGVVDAFDYQFKMNNNIQAIRDNLVLPEVNGAKITYTSSNPDIISTDGKVMRPVDSDKVVLFNATFENGFENTHITYSLIVKPVGEEETIVRLEEDLDWVIEQISSTNLASVTGNLAFPTKAPNGSNVSYTSSNTDVLTANGTVTRPSTDTDVSLNVRVYFADESRDKTINIRVKGATQQGGAIITPSGGTSPAGPSAGGPVTPVPQVTPTQPQYTYSDVTPSHWAYTAIEDLTKRGIVDGNDDGTFGPNNNIKREAFVKMLITAMGISVSNYETPFKDTKAVAWYYGYVATAVNEGIVNGIEDDFFGVGYNITRQDICVLIHRAFFRAATAQDADCNDFAEVSDYAKTAVSVMYSKGILNGDDFGNFNPKKPASRAEVSAIFSRLLSK